LLESTTKAIAKISQRFYVILDSELIQMTSDLSAFVEPDNWFTKPASNESTPQSTAVRKFGHLTSLELEAAVRDTPHDDVIQPGPVLQGGAALCGAILSRPPSEVEDGLLLLLRFPPFKNLRSRPHQLAQTLGYVFLSRHLSYEQQKQFS
jgi:hypothetical protein